MRDIRIFLSAQAGLFGAAALMCWGVIGDARFHSRAAIAETVIAGILILGLLGTFAAPSRSTMVALRDRDGGDWRRRSSTDYALHAAMLGLLVADILRIRRLRIRQRDPR